MLALPHAPRPVLPHVLVHVRVRLPILVLLVLAPGCATQQTGGRGRPAEAPTYAQLALVQNQRVDLLKELAARGVVELRWTDDDGREHFEPQVNADLWLDLPWHTALRCEKLGEVYMWLGSDESRFWLFDLTGEERVLTVGRHGLLVTRFPVKLRPLALVDMMGLSPLPGRTAPILWDETLEAWTVTTQGRGGPMRIAFERDRLLPLAVESLDISGNVIARSEVGRYTSLTVPGIAPGLYPKMPTLIDIESADGRGALKLAIGEIYIEKLEQVFDLARLIEALRPERLEELE